MTQIAGQFIDIATGVQFTGSTNISVAAESLVYVARHASINREWWSRSKGNHGFCPSPDFCPVGKLLNCKSSLHLPSFVPGISRSHTE